MTSINSTPSRPLTGVEERHSLSEMISEIWRRAALRGIDGKDGVDEIDASVLQAQALTGGVRLYIEPPTLPSSKVTDDQRIGAASFARHLDASLDAAFLTQAADGTERYRSLAQVKSEDLLAAFLKINIDDPNNSVETHGKLLELMNQMREAAIEHAKKANLLAEKKMQEAMAAEDDDDDFFSTISMIATVASMGMAAAALAAQMAAAQVAAASQTLAAQGMAQGLSGTALEQFVAKGLAEQMGSQLAMMSEQQVTAAIQEGMQNAMQNAIQDGLMQPQMLTDNLGKNVAQELQKAHKMEFSKLQSTVDKHKDTMRIVDGGAKAGAKAEQAANEARQHRMLLESQQAQAKAKRFDKMARELQGMIEEENAIIANIMESKNKTVDAILAMMSALAASKSKLASAGAAR